MVLAQELPVIRRALESVKKVAAVEVRYLVDIPGPDAWAENKVIQPLHEKIDQFYELLEHIAND